MSDAEDAVSINDTNDAKGFDLSPEARALADLKFTYVVTCQIYGKQKEDQKPEAADIALLMQRWILACQIYVLMLEVCSLLPDLFCAPCALSLPIFFLKHVSFCLPNLEIQAFLCSNSFSHLKA